MLKRTITAIIMAIVIIPLVILSRWPFMIGVALLSYMAGYELLNMMDKEAKSFKMLKFVAPLWNVLTIVTAYFYPSLVLPIMLLYLAVCLALAIIHPSFSIKSSVLLIFTYIYSGLSFLVIMNLRDVHAEGYFNNGLYLLAYLALVVSFTDMGAYILGRLFGKKKLCPTISPNKTIGGAIGGFIVGTIIGIAFYLIITRFITHSSFIPLNSMNAFLEIFLVVIFSMILSIAGQIGDLVASKLKRLYDVKDYGFIFPGHGGVMDRFDSLIFSSLVLYAIILLMVL